MKRKTRNHLKANSGESNLLLSSKPPTNVSIGDASFTTSIKNLNLTWDLE